MATNEELKESYTSTLQDLVDNNKTIIKVLTMVAEENVTHAHIIVEAIGEHLSQAQNDVKLPMLYLIDSIMKNSGPYITAFSKELVPLFCNVFRLADAKTRSKMYKLRETWKEILPKSKLYELDINTNQIDYAWPIISAPIHLKRTALKANDNLKETAFSPKPVNHPSQVTGFADTSINFEMQKRFLLKQRELLELQEKNVQLEVLKAQVKLQEHQAQHNTSDEEIKGLLLKRTAAAENPAKCREIIKNGMLVNLKQVDVGKTVPAIAPVVNVSRDPRLRRQQAAQQNTVKNQFENKANSTKSSNKNVCNKISVQNDCNDDSFVKYCAVDNVVSNSEISKSRDSLKSSQYYHKSSSGSDSTSSHGSPRRRSKVSRFSSKLPRECGSSSSDNETYLRGVREATVTDVKATNNSYKRLKSFSHKDVDLRGSSSPESVLSDSSYEKCLDIVLGSRQSKKRPSTEIAEMPLPKKSKSEELFGNDYIDLRTPSPKEADRQPTPPAPTIFENPTKPTKSRNIHEKENIAISNGTARNDNDWHAPKHKLTNATTKTLQNYEIYKESTPQVQPNKIQQYYSMPQKSMVVECSKQNIPKSIEIDGIPRDIIYYNETAIAFMTWDDPRELKFKSGQRVATIDDKHSFLLQFNNGYTEVIINGNVHKIRLGGPTREFYIDGKSYQCYFGGPSIIIDLLGKLTTVKLDGPLPEVHIGTTRRTDLVAGRVDFVINAKTILPVYLDGNVQNLEIDGQMHTLKFTDALQTVLLNGNPFPLEFGGVPKPVRLYGKKYFVRFTVLPRGIKPGHVQIRNMGGRAVVKRSKYSRVESKPSTVITAAVDTHTSRRRKTRFSDDSPERIASTSPTSPQNVLQPCYDMKNLSNVLAATASLQPLPVQPVSHIVNYEEQPSVVKSPALAQIPTPLISPTLNINALFDQLVATGIINSTTKEVVSIVSPPIRPDVMTSEVIAPTLEVIEPTRDLIAPKSEVIVSIPAPVKPRNGHIAIKPVSFDGMKNLKVRQPGIIQALYSGIQCSSCGMRFPQENRSQYSQHLDWHFRQNRKQKKNMRQAASRSWYYSVDDWKNFEEIEDWEQKEKCYFESQKLEGQSGNETDEEIEIPCIQADSKVPDPQCEVCREKLEQYYDEEKEEWWLRMAIRVNEITYHPLCYEDREASLMGITLDDSMDQSWKVDNKKIPGLDVSLIEKDDSVHIMDESQCLESSTTTQETNKQVHALSTDSDEDDDIIINEVEIEKINLDEYEFKRNMDNDFLSVVIKQEPIDVEPTVDQFFEVEESGFAEVNPIPNTTDHNNIDTVETCANTIENIHGHTHVDDDVFEIQDKQNAAPDTTHVKLVPAIDGNIELNSPASPTDGVGCKIKINITKQFTTKDNEGMSSVLNNQPRELTPAWVEPQQTKFKPALQGVKLKKLPPVNRDSEETGLCSIM